MTRAAFESRIREVLGTLAAVEKDFANLNAADAQAPADQIRQLIDKTIVELEPIGDWAAEERVACIDANQQAEELKRQLRACVQYDADLARADRDASLYGSSTQAMRSSGCGGAEYWAEMISQESSCGYASDQRKRRDEAYQSAQDCCRTIRGHLAKFVPSVSDPASSADKLKQRVLAERIRVLTDRIADVYGDEFTGGQVLADLADALFEAGQLWEAKNRYEAAEGHLRRSMQSQRLAHVEARLRELATTATS